MHHKTMVVMITGTFVFSLLLGGSALANKSAVSVEAPASAAQGSEITIKLNVQHNSNNFLHYTNWVYLTIDGKEIARWDFSRSKRPEGEIFTREVKYIVNGPLTIEAEAHCNIHGSKGKATHTVSVTE